MLRLQAQYVRVCEGCVAAKVAIHCSGCPATKTADVLDGMTLVIPVGGATDAKAVREEAELVPGSGEEDDGETVLEEVGRDCCAVEVGKEESWQLGSLTPKRDVIHHCPLELRVICGPIEEYGCLAHRAFHALEVGENALVHERPVRPAGVVVKHRALMECVGELAGA